MLGLQKIKGLQTDFQNIFDAWIEADMCNITALENAAAEASRSLAEVWSGALGSVRCEGQGVMCGFTPSDLSDWATRLQEIFALESFVFQSESRVFCYGDLRQLSSVLASAVAPTADDVCTTGGTVQDFENRYQAAIQPEIELALKRAVAKRCKRESNSGVCGTVFRDALERLCPRRRVSWTLLQSVAVLATVARFHSASLKKWVVWLEGGLVVSLLKGLDERNDVFDQWAWDLGLLVGA